MAKAKAGPVKNYPFEKFDYEDGSMADEHESWKTDITPVMAGVWDQPHEEVGEVHEYDDSFYAKLPNSNTKETGIVKAGS
jgi:hypothetical protein